MIEIPIDCPACGFKLQLINDQLFCKNSSCSAQLFKKIENFVKVLGIKGLGPKAVERLKLSDITELFYLDVSDLTSALNSAKLAEKLITEIEAAKSATLASVLASMSIPLIGKSAADKIASVVSNVDEINEDSCKKAGLGTKATQNLLLWLDTEFLEIREFLPFSFKSEGKTANKQGDTVCITGKLKTFKTKAEAELALFAAGFSPVDSVTKTTKYLVDEGSSSSSKRVKAEQYGITIITDLSDLLRNNPQNDN